MITTVASALSCQSNNQSKTSSRWVWLQLRQSMKKKVIFRVWKSRMFHEVGWYAVWGFKKLDKNRLCLALFSQFLSKFIFCVPGSAGRPVCCCCLRCSEHLLWGVGDVEEAVSVSVAGVNLPHAGGHAGHALLCHQEEQSLGGVQGNLIPGKNERKRWMKDGDNRVWGKQRTMAHLTARGRKWRGRKW